MATKDITDRQVLQAYLDRVPQGKFPYELLQERTGQPEKVCISATERALRRGLLNFGVSLRTGWLTDRGKEVLKADQ